MSKAAEKIKAYMLYVEKGLTGNEISKMIDVSQSGVRRWVHKCGWQAERDLIQKRRYEAGHRDKIDVESILSFKKFMKEKHPNLHEKIRESINEYLQLKA